MSTHKHFDRLCLAVLAAVLLLTVLLMMSAAPRSDGGGSDLFSEKDRNAVTAPSGAVLIALDGTAASVSGGGVTVTDGTVCITRGGDYILSGTFDGSVVIAATKQDTVHLYFDGVTVFGGDRPALSVEQVNRVYLTLNDGTENVLTRDVCTDGDPADGVIDSHDDLTLNGSGSLSVTANEGHGIVCRDDLIITGGTITVDAETDGIHAGDSVRLCRASLTVTAGDDGIHVSNDAATAFFYMESGSVSIPACYEGIEAISVTVAGGTVDIVCTDDGINANGTGTDSMIRQTGGTIRILNQNGHDADGLDSNGSIEISGGKLVIGVSAAASSTAIDYGSENGGTLLITGGTVIACGSQAMAEPPSASSAQGFIMRSVSALPAGTEVVLTDDNGNELIRETIPASFSSLLLSTPELTAGTSYTLTLGDNAEPVTVGTVENDKNTDRMPEMPGMVPDGAPMKPNGSEMPPDGGMRPDMGEMPNMGEMPDRGKMPNMGERPDMGEMPDRGEMPMPDRDERPAMENEPDAAIPTAAWLPLGLSVLALAIGLFFGIKAKF